jgi:hypothetical protein
MLEGGPIVFAERWPLWTCPSGCFILEYPPPCVRDNSVNSHPLPYCTVILALVSPLNVLDHFSVRGRGGSEAKFLAAETLRFFSCSGVQSIWLSRRCDSYSLNCMPRRFSLNVSESLRITLLTCNKFRRCWGHTRFESSLKKRLPHWNFHGFPQVFQANVRMKG